MGPRALAGQRAAHALGATLLLGGCGGSSGQPTARIPSVKSTSGAAPRPSRTTARQQVNLSPQRRRGLALQVVRTVLGQMALPVASVAMNPQATRLIVTIGWNGACEATPADEPRVKQVLARLLTFTKTIQVPVAGSGRSLGEYVAANCTPRTIPAGPGRVVFDRGGIGTIATPTLKITAKRWSVGYDSQASFLRISAAGTTFTVHGRAAGVRVFRGPGTFSVRMASPAAWRIQVRDGA